MTRAFRRASSFFGLTAVVLTAACATTSEQAADVQVVAVALADTMTIDVAQAAFAVGETVTFEVTNTGEVDHEFYVGDEDAQAAHAAEMSQMNGMAHDEPNGVSVAPGATERLEYTFQRAGELLGGCHEPGHYEAGMVIAVEVDEG